MNQQTIGACCLLATGLLWGTTGTAQTLAPPGYDALVVGLMRIAIGGLALLLPALWRRELGPIRQWPPLTTLVAALAVAAFQLAFFSAVDRTGVAIGTIVGLGSAPMFAGALAWFGFAERPGRRWLVATLFALTGCGLLMLAGRTGPVQVDPIGLLLSLAAGGAYAVYALTVKRLVGQRSSLAVMAVVGSLGALLILPLVWHREFAWLLQWRGLLVALYLGLVTYGLAMYLFARGMRLTPVATAVTLTLAEPLTAGLLGVIVVGERLSLLAWCGLALMLWGLLLLTVLTRRRPAVPGG